MIDPSRLIAGSRAVYGEEQFKRLYGEILPVPEHRVRVANDGDNLELAGRQLHFRDTPGHADHHFCIWDEQSKSWFSGDVFGLCYPQCRSGAGDLVIPTTTPVQFNPEKLIESIQLLLNYNPERILLTHYGELKTIKQTADSLCKQIERYTEIGRSCADVENRLEAITEKIRQYTAGLVTAWATESNTDKLMALLELDIKLNAQGVDVWLTRQQER